jgi:hypothetical protein
MSRIVGWWALFALCAVGCETERSAGAETQMSPSAGAGTAAPADAGSSASPAGGGGATAVGDPGAGTGSGAAGAAGSPPVGGGGGGTAGAGPIDEMPPEEPTEPEPPWDTLIEGEWEIATNTESYLCVRRTLPEDVFVSAFKAQNPPGTHHTVLTVGTQGGTDGITPCSSGVNAAAGVFGSGVGTEDLVMPEGVAFPLRAGQQLILNLHLFNFTDQPLTGASGTLVRSIPEDSVEHLAESALVTALLLNIPPGESVQYGQCTMTHDVTVFAVLPHMHMLGTRFKAAVTRGGSTLTLHDLPFEFESQMVYPIEPIELSQGEVVRTECTYDNTTDNVVTFGESSLDEMCNFGLFRYPAGANPSFACSF